MDYINVITLTFLIGIYSFQFELIIDTNINIFLIFFNIANHFPGRIIQAITFPTTQGTFFRIVNDLREK